jgi:hypothetical protein
MPRRPRRWPVRAGPLRGPVAVFCGLLPLVWAVRQKADGVVARAYQEHDPALLALARQLVQDGVLDELRGGSLEQALALLWDDLCAVAGPAEDSG